MRNCRVRAQNDVHSATWRPRGTRETRKQRVRKHEQAKRKMPVPMHATSCAQNDVQQRVMQQKKKTSTQNKTSDVRATRAKHENTPAKDASAKRSTSPRCKPRAESQNHVECKNVYADDVDERRRASGALNARVAKMQNDAAPWWGGSNAAACNVRCRDVLPHARARVPQTKDAAMLLMQRVRTRARRDIRWAQTSAKRQRKTIIKTRATTRKTSQNKRQRYACRTVHVKQTCVRAQRGHSAAQQCKTMRNACAQIANIHRKILYQTCR